MINSLTLTTKVDKISPRFIFIGENSFMTIDAAVAYVQAFETDAGDVMQQDLESNLQKRQHSRCDDFTNSIKSCFTSVYSLFQCCKKTDTGPTPTEVTEKTIELHGRR
jgi:hypothetical protein